MQQHTFDQLLSALPTIERILGHTFSEKALLAEAFIHTSFLNENKDLSIEHNERLEFLGDTILNLIVSEYLFCNFPKTPEGELSSIKARIVSKSACVSFLEEIDIGKYLLVGRGEKIQQKRSKHSLFGDLFEAVLGAMFLDAGFDTTKEAFFHLFGEKLASMVEQPEENYKSLLQEYCQKKTKTLPKYTVISISGPEHERVFEIAVFIEGKQIASAKGGSKKQAEQKAAQKALVHCEVFGEE